MRLPNAVHESQPWVIARVAPDFKLLDAWRLPAEGNADDFGTLVEAISSLDPAGGNSSSPTRALFWLRLRLGALFGWDDPAARLPIPGCTETSLSARIPEDLRDTTTPPTLVSSTTFLPIYRTDDEWAAEVSNRTVHGVLQLAWVEEGNGVYHGQMGIYVKPRGMLGEAYMGLIGPFRHLIVYPALMRQIERAWDARPRAHSSA
jgi:hypothetical protein